MRGFSAIGLDRAKDPLNVGSVMRAAHAYGASVVVATGGRYKRSRTDTGASYLTVPLIEADDLLAAMPVGCEAVAVELVDRAVSLYSFQHPRNAFYVFGPENGSLSPSILDKCKHVVQIPTAICLNLATCVTTVLYDRAMKANRNARKVA